MPHDLGVSIALDDVTSGYGTLKYCSGLAPRWIKVDSEITRSIRGDAQRRAILQLLAQVAREARVGSHRGGHRVRRRPRRLRRGGRLRRPGLFPGTPGRSGRPRPRKSFGRGSPRGAGRRSRSLRRCRPSNRRSRPSPPTSSDGARECAWIRRNPRPRSVRLDVWLDVACVLPTRSQAKLACEGGKVDVNGARARAHRRDPHRRPDRRDARRAAAASSSCAASPSAPSPGARRALSTRT